MADSTCYRQFRRVGSGVNTWRCLCFQFGFQEPHSMPSSLQQNQALLQVLPFQQSGRFSMAADYWWLTLIYCASDLLLADLRSRYGALCQQCCHTAPPQLSPSLLAAVAKVEKDCKTCIYSRGARRDFLVAKSIRPRETSARLHVLAPKKTIDKTSPTLTRSADLAWPRQQSETKDRQRLINDNNTITNRAK